MLKLYPMPISITEKNGTYEFSYVSVKGIENKTILDEYAVHGIKLSGGEPNVVYKKTEGLDEQEYELNIGENGAEILYSFEHGAFYGTQTLCQIINMKSVSFVEIKDAPLNKNRVFHFDISRGKLPTMKHFKELIDYAAMARYNVFSLYYETLVIKFPSLEGLWEEDSYTLEEMYQIKQWCNEKFIKMQIEINSFGHMSKFLCHDRFKHLSNSLDENNPGCDLNPLDPRSIELVDMLLQDVIPFCDTDFQMIHGDEVHSLKSSNSKSWVEVEKRGVNAVYMEYMSKVCNLVIEKYHKMPQVANDMFMHNRLTDDEMRENLKSVPKGAIIACWGYESEYERYDFGGHNKLLKEAGIMFMNFAGTGLWGQYVPRTYNQMLNAEVACRSGYENGAHAVVQCIWGDSGHSQFSVMELGGIFIFGATAWNCYDYQLSYVFEYLDKYVFKSTKGSMARTIASFGDAAWYGKVKVPFNNSFAAFWATPYTTEPLFNGYHRHTCLNKIRYRDAFDEYGCQRAIDHVENSKRMLQNVEFDYKDSSVEKEKIFLNLRMFELAVRASYFKLCVIVLKDYDTARSLVADIEACFADIFANYVRLWNTENRENGSQIFMGLMQRSKATFDENVKRIM